MTMCKNCDKIDSTMKGADPASLDSLGEIIECPKCKQKWILEMKQGNHYNPPTGRILVLLRWLQQVY